MNAGLSLRFDRAPDYFALHRAHSEDHETWLLRDGDQILGIGSFVVRQAWLNGQSEPVVYMADLRAARRRSVAGLWRSWMRSILLKIRARTGAQLAFCSILRDNKAGRNALLRASRADSMSFEHLCGYSNVSIVARKPWANSDAKGFVVRRARSEDESRLRSFVDAQSSQTQFGPVFDTANWSRRMQGWPDFGIERFYLAFDDTGRLAGCLAPWDSAAINRIVIDRLPRAADFVRHICNTLSPLTRRPRVRIGPGSHLPDISLSHVFIEGRSADVFTPLLQCALRDIFTARRHATVSVCLYDNDPLWSALGRYWYVAVPMDLYWVDIAAIAGEGSPRSLEVASDRLPGFESYLV